LYSFSAADSFGEPHDRGHRLTCERSKQRFQLTAFDVDCDIDRAFRIVRQSSEHGLGTTQDIHAFGLTPFDAIANEFESFHGANG